MSARPEEQQQHQHQHKSHMTVSMRLSMGMTVMGMIGMDASPGTAAAADPPAAMESDASICVGGSGSSGGGGGGTGTAETQQRPTVVAALSCADCGTSTTPLWRRDDTGNTICNACGLYFKLHGTHRSSSRKKTVIKRRKRVYAAVSASTSAGSGGIGPDAGTGTGTWRSMSDQAADQSLHSSQASLPSIHSLRPFLPPSRTTMQHIGSNAQPSSYLYPHLPPLHGQQEQTPQHQHDQQDSYAQASEVDDYDHSGPPKKKYRRGLACTECRRLKIRCDGTQPCPPCTRQGEQDTCQYIRRSKHSRPIQGPTIPDSRVIRRSDTEELERMTQSNSAGSSNKQGSGLFSSANNVGVYGGSMISAAGNITIVHAPESGNGSTQVRNSDVNTTENGPVQETESPLSSLGRPSYPQRSCDVYYQNLVTKRRGSPLWIPEPSYNLPVPYQRKGVSIGDVGVLSASGSFTFFFNICLPSDHPINSMGVPEGFHPVSPPLIHHDVQAVQEFNADSYIASESIETSRQRRSDSSASELTFESSAEQGAVLTMPHGAQSEDLVNTLRFRGYIAKNIENWYRYIIGVRGCEATNGDVRLVIGCDKTDLWGMAAFVKSTETVRLKFQPVSMGQSYKWEYSGSFDTRTGPDSAVVERLQQSGDDGRAREETYNNQCLFVRTLNANLHAKVWKDIALKIYSDMGIDFEEFSKGRSHESSVIMQTEAFITASQGSGGSLLVDHVEEGRAATDGLPSFEQSAPLNDSNVSMSMMQHPSNAINELLWEHFHDKYPTAKAIITGDSHWIDVLRSNEDERLPNASELFQRIIEKGPEINLDREHDCISLCFPSDEPKSQDDENLFDESTNSFPTIYDEYENRFSPYANMASYFSAPHSFSAPVSPATPADRDFSYYSDRSRAGSRASSRHSLGDRTNLYDNQASPMRSRSASRRRNSDNEDVERKSRSELVRKQRIQHEQQFRDKLRDGFKKLKHVLPASDTPTSKLSVLNRAAERIAELEKEIEALKLQSGYLDSDCEKLQVTIDTPVEQIDDYGI